jgi:transcriptional regulator with XRE-family HTH domain
LSLKDKLFYNYFYILKEIDHIIQKFKKLIKENNLSETLIAKKTPTTRPTLRNYLSGETLIKLDFLIEFSKWQKIPMTYWFEEGKENQHTNSIKESQSEYLLETSDMKKMIEILEKQLDEKGEVIKHLRKLLDRAHGNEENISNSKQAV